MNKFKFGDKVWHEKHGLGVVIYAPFHIKPYKVALENTEIVLVYPEQLTPQATGLNAVSGRLRWGLKLSL